ncbi:MAG: hypothetical protein P1V97_34930, partial [Planctomycetota bacterium]|nr:hypothetical protein [Planctomycetota bacterium]
SNRAKAYTQINQWGKAIADYNWTIRWSQKTNEFPKVWAILRRDRGFCFYKVRRFDLALEDLNFVIKSYPGDVKSYDYRVRVNLALKQWEKVIDDCSTLLSLSAPSPEGYYAVRGDAYNQMGQTRKAIDNFELAVQKSTDRQFKTIMRGMVTKLKKQLAEQ